MNIKQEMGKMTWVTVSWLLCLTEMLLAQSRKLLAAVTAFPVSPPPFTTACSLWTAQRGIPSPLLWGEGTFLNQLPCLGIGPIVPVGGPAAPPMTLHHLHITCPYRRKPPH